MNKKLNFCSYFNHNYIAKFLVMYESLSKFDDYNFYIIALDSATENFFSENKSIFPNIIVIPESEIRTRYDQLNNAKSNRSLVEYFFTLSPFVPLYIFEKYNLDKVTYLDCDLYFFSSPKVLIDNTFYSISVVKQGFKDIRYGRLNVGFIIYNNDKFTLKILNRWSEQCVEWCYDYIHSGKYADQKYLDEWIEFNDNVKILDCLTCNVAPWNFVENQYFFDNNLLHHKTGKKVIFFHFHGLDLMDNNNFSAGFSTYNKTLSDSMLEKIYKPYVSHLLDIENRFKLKSSTGRYSLMNINILNKFRVFTRLLKKNAKIFYFKDNHSIK